jgi:hypothetical protein
MNCLVIKEGAPAQKALKAEVLPEPTQTGPKKKKRRRRKEHILAPRL